MHDAKGYRVNASTCRVIGVHAGTVFRWSYSSLSDYCSSKLVKSQDPDSIRTYIRQVWYQSTQDCKITFPSYYSNQS